MADLFKVRVDLIVFKALQQNGIQSFERLSDITGIHPTTIQYAVERLREREFYDIKAIPRLNRFQDKSPMAVIGFSDAHPIAIEQLEKDYRDMPEVMTLLKGEKEVILFMIDSSKEKLAGKLFDIMKRIGQKPSIYITSLQISKNKMTIPDKILDAVYADLPDRRMRSSVNLQ